MSSRSFIPSLILLSCSCFAGPPSAEELAECNDDRPCPAGQACVRSACEQVCARTQECPLETEACFEGICQTYVGTCFSNQDCPEGWFCDNDVCRRDLSVGTTCMLSTDCSAGFCVDGVCCNTACDSECEACSALLTGEPDGACVPIPMGEDPEDECTPIQGCDGAGACDPGLADGTACSLSGECTSQFCADNLCCDTACDGECEACAATLTGGADGSCAAITMGTDPDNECAFDQGCDGTGLCHPGDPPGTSCSVAGTCSTQHCVDDVCCDTACGSTCESCNLSDTGVPSGSCAPIPENDDPQSECAGNNCSGLGSCKGALGRPCLAGQECVSGYCLNQMCSLPPSITPPGPVFPWNGLQTGTDRIVANRQPCFEWNAAQGGVGQITYTLQIDEVCQLDDFANCPFTSPEVELQTTATTICLASPVAVRIQLPRGTRYYWRLRACDGLMTCSAWSAVRYLDVGREPKDINGDGYADLIVGSIANGSPNTMGRVYYYLGSSTGLGGPNGIDSPEPVPADQVRFGNDVAVVGDTNGDGYNDVAILASGGRAYLSRGGLTGLSASLDDFNPIGVTGSSGFIKPAGDMDGDGYADVAVAASSYGGGMGGHGAVYVFYGGPGAFSFDFGHRFLHPLPGSAGPNGLIGRALAGGVDFDRDGFADVSTLVEFGDSTDLQTVSADLYFLLGRPGKVRPTTVRITNNSGGTVISRSLDAGMYQSKPITPFVEAQYSFDGMGAVTALTLAVLGAEYDGAAAMVSSLSMSSTTIEVSLGDIDGDGLNDLIRYFGDVEIDTTSAPGFMIAPPAGSQFFGSVDWAVLGDIDADGFDELAFTDQMGPTQRVQVYWGSASSIAAPTTLADPDADTGFAESLD